MILNVIIMLNYVRTYNVGTWSCIYKQLCNYNRKKCKLLKITTSLLLSLNNNF